MAQETIKVRSDLPVTVDLTFRGIARYAAYLFEPAAGAEPWKLSRVLVQDASSVDARPDVVTFDPTPALPLLFVLIAEMTGIVVPADLKATATVVQDDNPQGEASEGGHIDSGSATVVVRILLERP